MTSRFHPHVLAFSAAAVFAAPAVFAENVKIAFIDPLSGPFAPVGQGILHSWQMIADIANKENGPATTPLNSSGSTTRPVRRNR
jgi:branched-chain amino acid transport system substrate-binding protein